MESISVGLSSCLTFPNHPKTHNSTSISKNFRQSSFPKSNSYAFLRTLIPSTPRITSLSQTHALICTLKAFQMEVHHPIIKKRSFPNHIKSHFSFLMGLTLPLPSLAADSVVPTEEVPNRINLEGILVSIDNFFNRYPFFVAGVTFIWLVAIPLTKEYLQKYKFISAIDAFRKLRDDPNAQLLDIREEKSLQYLSSPNLKILNKNVIQVEFSEGDEEGFVMKVLKKFRQPSDTTLCILDNFDGNSMKVAELLFKNGFKEAYAIRGGIRGKDGWQAIQESLLPSSVHVYSKEKVKASQQPETNGAANEKGDDLAPSPSALSLGKSEKIEDGYVNPATEATVHQKSGSRSLSPYPNYPDLKPPSSPTPSKP